MAILGVVFAIIAIILFINVLINAIKSLRKKGEGFDKKSMAIRAGAAFVLFVVGVIITPVDEDNSADKSAESGAKADEMANKEDTYDITSESDVERLIIDVLGDTTNTDEKRVESVILNDLDYIGITLNADENLTAKLAKKGILKDTLTVMETLNKEGYEGNFSATWRMSLTDSHGNTELGKVLSIDISSEDFMKINYDNFDYNKMPDIASDYFEHPGFNK